MIYMVVLGWCGKLDGKWARHRVVLLQEHFRVFPDRQKAIVSRHPWYPILFVVRPHRGNCELINLGGRLSMYGLDVGERHNVEP